MTDTADSLIDKLIAEMEWGPGNIGVHISEQIRSEVDDINSENEELKALLRHVKATCEYFGDEKTLCGHRKAMLSLLPFIEELDIEDKK